MKNRNWNDTNENVQQSSKFLHCWIPDCISQEWFRENIPSQSSSDCHLLERAHVVSWKRPDLSFLSISIVHCNFPSLALTARYKESEASQKRLLRYIKQGSHVLLWHKNTIYWDSAVHLGRICAVSPISLFFSSTALTAPLKTTLMLTFILWASIWAYQRHSKRAWHFNAGSYVELPVTLCHRVIATNVTTFAHAFLKN